MHWGKSIQAGHYVSNIKRNEKWYFCDDNEITEIKEEKIYSKYAYLLFYRQDNQDLRDNI